jgi:hypothetical protein
LTSPKKRTIKKVKAGTRSGGFALLELSKTGFGLKALNAWME